MDMSFGIGFVVTSEAGTMVIFSPLLLLREISVCHKEVVQ